MVKFKHDADDIYQAMGFESRDEYKKVLNQLKPNFKSHLKKKDDNALLILAYELTSGALMLKNIIPIIELFMNILTYDTKPSHIVELVYRKLKLFEPDVLVKIATNYATSMKESIEVLSMLEDCIVMSIVNRMNAKDNKKEKDNKEE